MHLSQSLTRRNLPPFPSLPSPSSSSMDDDNESLGDFDDMDLGGNALWASDLGKETLMASFPVVPDTVTGLLSLLQITSVRQMVRRHFYKDGEMSIEYPARGKTLPNQHKACKICGRLGHNTTTHHKTLGLAAEASRHVLCLMKNGENMQSEEVMKQIELVLGALAGITLVAQDNQTPLVMKTLREIKVLYDNLLSWVTHSENRHSRHVVLTPHFEMPGFTVIHVRPETDAATAYRTTLSTAKALMEDVCAGPVVLPDMPPPLPPPPPTGGTAAGTKAPTQLFLFPDYDMRLSEMDKRDALQQDLNQFFATRPDAEATYAVPWTALHQVTNFAACRHCRFLGHIANVCESRTPGTRLLLCLATLLDAHKQHRLDNHAVRKSLFNVQRTIWALAYAYWKSKGHNDRLCDFHLSRFKTPPGKPSLLVLMRTFNHAAVTLMHHPDLGKHIVLSTDGTLAIGDAADDTLTLSTYTLEMRQRVLAILSKPELLPRIAVDRGVDTHSPTSRHGIRPSQQILMGLTSRGREDCSGLDELRHCSDRGDLTEEELQHAATLLLSQWRTPHVPQSVQSIFDADNDLSTAVETSFMVM